MSVSEQEKTLLDTRLARLESGETEIHHWDQVKNSIGQKWSTFKMTPGITIDPAICHGRPVLHGTRVLVSTILAALAGGDSREIIADDYGLSDAQIAAALQFAAKITDRQYF